MSMLEGNLIIDLDFFRDMVSGSKTKRRREKWMIWVKREGSQLAIRSAEDSKKRGTNGRNRGELDLPLSILERVAVTAIIPARAKERMGQRKDEGKVEAKNGDDLIVTGQSLLL